MAENDRTTRRLVAILAADVVGYSRMMGADEAGTLAALKRHRETVFNPAVVQHRGRVVKLIGDGTLVEFTSVVDAVNCALAIQRTIAARGTSAANDIALRIGVNLGDVIVEDDDIYGDGVNVAARLEPLAEPNGICIASIVKEGIGNRVDAAFKDGGEVSVKNIDHPTRIWKWHPIDDPIAARTRAASVGAGTPGSDLPSIAVLPFDNMSNDPEQEYFSDGITEDIITDLSKVAGLAVIARNSSFAYKGRRFDVRTVARDLGVTSVLEGSIRRAGSRIRVTAQLIQASTGAHLWADRYDRDMTDIFAVQDDVTEKIVEALKVRLTPNELARIADVPTRSVEAHDLYLKARELLRAPDVNREKYEQAIAFFERATEIDPEYAQAYAGLALAHMFDYTNRWSADPDASLRRADELATKAVTLNPNEPDAQVAVSLPARYLGDDRRSQEAIEKALTLNPNFALALNIRGAFTAYSGEPEKGIPDSERAMQLDPGYSQQYLYYLGLAHFLGGHYEIAAAMCKERILLVPKTDVTRAIYAAALGHLGRFEQAKATWSELKQINPRFSVSEHFARTPFRDHGEVARIMDGLAKAGLPD